MNPCMSWQPIETAPREYNTKVLVLFNSASVPVVRLCWYDDGAPQPWNEDRPRPNDVGWWSYKHSVTQEKIDLTAVAWMPYPNDDAFMSDEARLRRASAS